MASFGSRIIQAFEAGKQAKLRREQAGYAAEDRDMNRKLLKLNMDRLKFDLSRMTMEDTIKNQVAARAEAQRIAASAQGTDASRPVAAQNLFEDVLGKPVQPIPSEIPQSNAQIELGIPSGSIRRAVFGAKPSVDMGTDALHYTTKTYTSPSGEEIEGPRPLPPATFAPMSIPGVPSLGIPARLQPVQTRTQEEEKELALARRKMELEYETHIVNGKMIRVNKGTGETTVVDYGTPEGPSKDIIPILDPNTGDIGQWLWNENSRKYDIYLGLDPDSDYKKAQREKIQQEMNLALSTGNLARLKAQVTLLGELFDLYDLQGLSPEGKIQRVEDASGLDLSKVSKALEKSSIPIPGDTQGAQSNLAWDAQALIDRLSQPGQPRNAADRMARQFNMESQFLPTPNAPEEAETTPLPMGLTEGWKWERTEKSPEYPHGLKKVWVGEN